MKPPEPWPRIRDLPEAERQPFTEFLNCQTVPWIEGEPESEQDGYFEQDYLRFKARQRAPK